MDQLFLVEASQRLVKTPRREPDQAARGHVGLRARPRDVAPLDRPATSMTMGEFYHELVKVIAENRDVLDGLEASDVELKTPDHPALDGLRGHVSIPDTGLYRIPRNTVRLVLSGPGRPHPDGRLTLPPASRPVYPDASFPRSSRDSPEASHVRHRPRASLPRRDRSGRPPREPRLPRRDQSGRRHRQWPRAARGDKTGRLHDRRWRSTSSARSA